MIDKESRFKFFQRISALVSVVLLISLAIDYFFTDEFPWEGIFLVAIFLVLGLNLIRQIRPAFWRIKWLGILSNLAVLGFSLFGFAILFLTALGYGFAGQFIHPVWISTALCNFLIFFLTIIDVLYLLRNTKLASWI